MSSSILRFLLTHQLGDADVVLKGIDAGEIDIKMAVESDPNLLRDMFVSVGRKHEYSINAKNAHPEIAQRLEQAGAAVWGHNTDLLDAFDHALRVRHAPLLQWLANRPDAPEGLADRHLRKKETSPLFHVRAEVARVLLGIGFDCQVRNHLGNTLLHEADDAELAKLYLEAGLDPHAVNDNGEDVKKVWDKSNMLQAKRKEMDDELLKHAQPDPQRLIREFGEQVLEVGLPSVRERFATAGINPRSARHEGLSLPELLVAEMLKRGLKVNSYATGEPVDHRKCRRMLIGALRWYGDLGVDSASDRIKASMSVFQCLDHLTESKPRYDGKPSGQGNKLLRTKKKAPKPDTTRGDIELLTGALRGDKNKQLHLKLDAIERMVAGGVLDNGSQIAAWLLRDDITKFTPSEWMLPDAKGEALYLRALRLAVQGNWNSQWAQKNSLVFRHSPLDNIQCPRGLPPLLHNEPNAIPALLTLANLSKFDESTQWIKKQIVEGGALNTLSSHKGWMNNGLGHIEKSETPEMLELARMVRSQVDQDNLQRDTPKLSKPSRGARL